MRRPLVILVLLAVFATIQGCASIGLENPFSSDPLTGGTDAPTSQLLGVAAPAGMQRYASHGFQSFGPGGERQGLEVLRGQVNTAFAAQIMHSGLQSQGWQLRLALRKGARAVYVYDRGAAMAVLTFESQALLTIMNIWTGDRLPDGAPLPMQDAADAADAAAAPPAGDSGGSGDSGGMNTAPQGGPGGQGGNYGGGNNSGGGGLQERTL